MIHSTFKYAVIYWTDEINERWVLHSWHTNKKEAIQAFNKVKGQLGPTTELVEITGVKVWNNWRT